MRMATGAAPPYLDGDASGSRYRFSVSHCASLASNRSVCAGLLEGRFTNVQRGPGPRVSRPIFEAAISTAGNWESLVAEIRR